eukprot:TRINITY_DN7093_c0_g1_i2.p1 TRINITY_DN7093_c0_g1~~TRINITY_DN7093_c0_g1_i2.p1  ORF type:complete len:565 (-),score=192.94 TRINITY_DN7093_c0_g1_i2:291-1985(-)
MILFDFLGWGFKSPGVPCGTSPHTYRILCRLLFDEEIEVGSEAAHKLAKNVFERLFLLTFGIMEQVWTSMKASYMDFPQVLINTADAVEQTILSQKIDNRYILDSYLEQHFKLDVPFVAIGDNFKIIVLPDNKIRKLPYNPDAELYQQVAKTCTFRGLDINHVQVLDPARREIKFGPTLGTKLSSLKTQEIYIVAKDQTHSTTTTSSSGSFSIASSNSTPNLPSSISIIGSPVQPDPINSLAPKSLRIWLADKKYKAVVYSETKPLQSILEKLSTERLLKDCFVFDISGKEITVDSSTTMLALNNVLIQNNPETQHSNLLEIQYVPRGELLSLDDIRAPTTPSATSGGGQPGGLVNASSLKKTNPKMNFTSQSSTPSMSSISPSDISTNKKEVVEKRDDYSKEKSKSSSSLPKFRKSSNSHTDASSVHIAGSVTNLTSSPSPSSTSNSSTPTHVGKRDTYKKSGKSRSSSNIPSPLSKSKKKVSSDEQVTNIGSNNNSGNSITASSNTNSDNEDEQAKILKKKSNGMSLSSGFSSSPSPAKKPMKSTKSGQLPELSSGAWEKDN